MNLKLTNPLRGSWEPWPLAMRLNRFALTAAALLFRKTHARTFEKVVRQSTGFLDPQALPEQPRRIASALSAAGTAFLFLGIGFAFARRYHALWALAMAGLLCAVSGLWLKRTVWGLPTDAGRPHRFAEVLRRLVRVIRHGYP